MLWMLQHSLEHDGLGTKPTVRISLSMQENHVLSNLAWFLGIVTAGTE